MCDVRPALKEGLVIPSDEAYGFMEDVDAGDNISYRFLHDRVQQAAYSLIDEEKKTQAHLKIGRLLLNSTSESEPDDLLFDMTNHLNLGKLSAEACRWRGELNMCHTGDTL